MEEDVVLADEVELLRFGIRPPLAPRFFLDLELAPLNRGGEVADDGLEPHVQFLRVPARLAHRDGDAPIQVARDGARFESLGFDLSQKFLMLGDDMETDIQAAKNLGADSILIYTGKTQPPLPSDSVIKPDHEAMNLLEVIDLLEKSN